MTTWAETNISDTSCKFYKSENGDKVKSIENCQWNLVKDSKIRCPYIGFCPYITEKNENISKLEVIDS